MPGCSRSNSCSCSCATSHCRKKELCHSRAQRRGRANRWLGGDAYESDESTLLSPVVAIHRRNHPLNFAAFRARLMSPSDRTAAGAPLACIASTRSPGTMPMASRTLLHTLVCPPSSLSPPVPLPSRASPSWISRLPSTTAGSNNTVVQLIQSGRTTSTTIPASRGNNGQQRMAMTSQSAMASSSRSRSLLFPLRGPPWSAVYASARSIRSCERRAQKPPRSVSLPASRAGASRSPNTARMARRSARSGDTRTADVSVTPSDALTSEPTDRASAKRRDRERESGVGRAKADAAAAHSPSRKRWAKRDSS
mmetsp:Transcript_13317/g.41967  ORF Transcript_13317/g.41967 Transcript_13317/m.41967 type:complete len:309 (+) Transcript_13317:397-1323(+)